jgi:spore germination cell wall hydrolase CwlJ-like protein
MGYSRTGWAAGAIAPWCLGMALAVSMSADAGQEAASGATFAPMPLRAPAPPIVLVPPQPPALRLDFGKFPGEARKVLRQARLSTGGGEEFKRLADEIEPRADLKRNARQFPEVDRSNRGDPLAGLRPAFDTRLRDSQGLAKFRANDLIFHHDEAQPAAAFAVPDDEASGPDSVAAFEPWPVGDSPVTAHSSAEPSPGRAGSAMTMRPAAINERLMQGATPAIRRAVTLGSATPSLVDSAPVEVVALAGVPRTRRMGEIPATGVRRNYAALIDQDNSARENRCLAEAIYFEARGESGEGQAAVAQVVMNRVSSGLYPATICGVVYQNRWHYNACQFSFACEGKSLRIDEPDAWRQAVRIAGEVTNGKTYVYDIGGSTHFHANYVRPRWARRLEKMDVIGHHIFYKLRPGQS